jgi:LPXTG-motif cell wall-anchored protein
MVLFGLMAGPASAEGDTGTIDTGPGNVALYTEPGAVQKTTTDPCQGNVCERIDWCDNKVGAEPSATAPVVVIDGTKGGPPQCMQKPKIQYGCCVADKHGTAKVAVPVYNPNAHKFKVRVWVGDGTPIEKWIAGGATETFRFYNVPNGTHKVHAAVWAGGNAWCKFGHKVITVKCATPAPTTPVTTKPTTPPSTPPTSSSPTTGTPTTPSTSPDHTPPTSEAPSPGPGESPSPDAPSLPVTGSGTPVAAIAGTGAGLVVLGGLAFFLLRRGRRQPEFIA